jgi:hypothetical protein
VQKFNRSVRRHHRERLKVKRSNHYCGIKEFKEKDRARILSIWVRTSTICSCWCCGNPRTLWPMYGRRYRASTMQEMKAFDFACVEE